MNHIELNNTLIPYKLTKKKNKNTYFYFKRQGYIQINLSKYQTEKDAINHMKKNANLFVSKYHINCFVADIDLSKYQLLGDTYEFETHKDMEIWIDYDKKIIHTPTEHIQHKIYYDFEKKLMLEILHKLHNKYLNNPYVDVKNINIKTRYTSSRHGSCNARKRNININLNLIKFNIKYIEYVFLHEITHLKYQNHGKEFYNLFEKLCPNYQQYKKELKNIYR